MKIVQTFWTGNRNLGLQMDGGWRSPEYHWMSWALSALQAEHLYGNVELVTDTEGKRLLIDILQLPYTKVSTYLDGKLENCSPSLFSLAKLYTYSVQTEPFFHIDGDCFLWKRFDAQLECAGLVSQNLEVDLFFYRDVLATLKGFLPILPDILPTDNTSESVIFASNAGVIGGTNLNFIRQYADTASQLIQDCSKVITEDEQAGLNFLFEQCYLYYFAEKQGIHTRYVFPEPVSDPAYQGYVRFTDIPEISMIHTVGANKTIHFICEQVAKRLRQYYPAYYHKIISACKEHRVRLHTKVYEHEHFNTVGSLEADVETQLYFGDLKFDFKFENKVFESPIPTVKNLKDSFKRTLDYLQFTADLSITFTDTQLSLKSIKEAVSSGSKQEFINRGDEIFLLELHKLLLHNFLWDNAIQLYYQYKKKFETLDMLFNMDSVSVQRLVIEVDPNTIVLTPKWNWESNYYASAEMMVETVNKNEAGLYTVALVPDPICLFVQEHHLDQLDMIVADHCGKSKTIEALFVELEPYFDAAELKQDYQSYKKLVVDTVKRLAHLSILHTEKL